MFSNMLKKIVALGTALLFTVSMAEAKEAPTLNEGAKGALEAELASLEGEVYGLGVILYKDGQEVYRRFTGYSAPDKTPLTDNTRFRAGDLSAMFTAFTYMQLAERKIINLDDEVSPYVGFTLRNPAYPDIPITFRMLLNHTSSLRDDKVYSTPPIISVKEFFYPMGMYWEGGRHFAPQGEVPGEYFCYAHLNYGVLGTALEALTRQRFDRFQKNNILAQLLIKADYVPANFDAADFAKLGVPCRRDQTGKWQAAVDYFPEGQPARNTLSLQNPEAPGEQGTFNIRDYHPGINATIFAPAGGLRISGNELKNALEMLINKGVFLQKPVLSPGGLEALTAKQWQYNGANGDTADNTYLSYGWGLYQIDGQAQGYPCDLIGNNGGDYGVQAGLFYRPGSQDGFIYLLNGAEKEQAKKIMTALCAAMVK
ncbi:MAG: beta-lactamase family protein [Selenomonadaceae bacterium]|nr:beta-lactamase family protein [Selenomonadaceae bacterium]